MRLYLSAESKLNIGYTPDWLRVTFEQDGNELELTLDIQGNIDYDANRLNCRCKGELIPWALYNLETGDATDLSVLSIEELDNKWPDSIIADIIAKSKTYEVGIYPVCDTDGVLELSEKDILSNCEGCFEMYIDENTYYDVDFQFDIELNTY